MSGKNMEQVTPLTIQSACPYCGVGCGVNIDVDKGRLRGAAGCTEIRGNDNHPANQGALCVKGATLKESLSLPNRLLYPRLRQQANVHNISWDQAISTIAEKLTSTIAEHGPDSVAMYVSGQLLTEDYYVANKLMKGFVGSANIDTNSRLCMSSAVAAHQRAFGEDLVPVHYDDIAKASLIVIVGANTAWTHPVLFRRIQQARERNPALRLVVIDPRRTITAKQADLHLPIANDGDVLLFNGLLRYLHEQNQLDTTFIAQHCEGMAALEQEISREVYQLTAAADALEITRDTLEAFYRLFRDTPNTLTLFCQGVNQSASGTDKANAIINCHLATGRIGKPGTGPFSLTGQPNAMGGREVGGLANQLAVHRGFDPDSVAAVQTFWQAPNMAERPGLKAVDLFDAMYDGRIKFVWVIATNPVVSLPDSRKVVEALQRCDCVVVSDISPDADTAAYADILLPAAGWGEKEGMVTNSERMLTRQRAFLPAPGQARPDWWAICEVAKRAGFRGFDFPGVSAIFREFAALSGINRDTSLQFDLSELATLSDDDYARWQPQRWPLGRKCHLFSDGQFPTQSGRANLVAVRSDVPPVSVEGAAHATSVFGRIISNSSDVSNISNSRDVSISSNGNNVGSEGWWLNTGRQRDQWHTMTRTGHIARLAENESEPTVYMHPLSARQYSLDAGQLVQLNLNDSSVLAKLAYDEGLSARQLYMSMHWAGDFGFASRVNQLVPPVVDVVSGQPAFKSAQISLSVPEVASYGLWIGEQPPPFETDFLSFQTGFSANIWRFACRSPLTKASLYAGSHHRNPYSHASSHQILILDGLGQSVSNLAEPASETNPPCLNSAANKQTSDRSWAALLLAEQKLNALCLVSARPLTAEPQAYAALFDKAFSVSAFLALAAAGQAPAQLVCSCFRVTDRQIQQAVSREGIASLNGLQAKLKCGANCGACLSEVKALLKQALDNQPLSESEGEKS